MQLAASLRLGVGLRRPPRSAAASRPARATWLGDDLGQGRPGVDAEADQVLHLGRLGGQLVLARRNPASSMARRIRSSWSSLSRIVKLGSIAQELGRPAEQAVADMVKRPGPDLARLVADQGVQPPHHLPRCAAGEGDQQDRVGRNAPGDQVGHAVGDDPRLARSRPGQDQVIAVGRHHRRPLRLVQILVEMPGSRAGNECLRVIFRMRRPGSLRPENPCQLLPDYSSLREFLNRQGLPGQRVRQLWPMSRPSARAVHDSRLRPSSWSGDDLHTNPISLGRGRTRRPGSSPITSGSASSRACIRS